TAAVVQQLPAIGLEELIGGLAGVIAHAGAELDHGVETDTAIDRAFGEIVELEVALVPQNQLELRTPDAEAVGDALQRRVQQRVAGLSVGAGAVRMQSVTPSTTRQHAPEK